MSVFINFSNHPSDKWSVQQYDAALKYGEVVDIEFPNIEADAKEFQIYEIAEKYYAKIVAMNPSAVMIQGEFSLVFQLVSMLMDAGIKCVTACSRRESIEKVMEDGAISKQAIFRFVAFREYQKH